MELREKFVERINEFIDDSPLSFDELCADMAMDKDNMYHWKSKTYKFMPSVNHIIAIANYFNCSVDYLVGYNDVNWNPNPNKNAPPFSQRLKEVIKENNTNIYRLSNQIGLSTTSQMYKWLNGKEGPQIESVIRIAKAVNNSIDYVLGR